MTPFDPKGEAARSPGPGPTSANGPVRADGSRGGDEEGRAGRGRAWWANRLTNGAILAVLAVACAFLLTPGVFSARADYGDQAVGQFSQTVSKADRDYDIPDDETTRRKRDEAREAVLPVYDYDLTVADAAVDRIRSAFQLMRKATLEVEEALEAREPADLRPEDSRRKPPRKRDEKEDDQATLLSQQAFAKAYAAQREEWQRRLETHLDEETFQAFSAARFGDEVERDAQRLMMRVNGQMVAEYRDPLALSGGRGISVRSRNLGQVVGERLIRDVSPIRDQTEVRQESDRWVSELPADWSLVQRRAVATLVARQVRANLRFNREETEDRRKLAAESVKPVVIQLKKGEKIIGDGERIERRHLVIFQAMRSQAGAEESWPVRAGGGLLAAVLVVAVYGFARSSLRRFRPTRKDALLGALGILLLLGMVNLSVTVSDALHDRFPRLSSEALYYAVPFAAGAMLVRFVLAAEAAVVFAVIFSFLCGLLVGSSLEFGIYVLLGSLVAADKVARAKDRAALFRAGLHTGLVNAAVVFCFALLDNRVVEWNTAVGCLSGFLGGALLVPMLVMGVAPLVEAGFGYTTDIKLLELANLNHPALKELIVRAPGTYHHSIIIGSLVEAAAEAIGANPLLARVCAYYHDVGKGRNPLYFGENQRGENRHDKLAPQMSALVIKRHVTDGVELARNYKLPKQVIDAIPQHHGTRLVGFFFHKALKEAEGKADSAAVDESLYRYSGPKPQSREAALVMVADAVEASTRAMSDPTPAKLQVLVQKVINGIFVDGQLDECDLTLRDLNEMARSFFRVLGGIYHSRPDYPPGALLVGVKPQLTEVPRPVEPVRSGERPEPKKTHSERWPSPASGDDPAEVVVLPGKLPRA